MRSSSRKKIGKQRQRYGLEKQKRIESVPELISEENSTLMDRSLSNEAIHYVTIAQPMSPEDRENRLCS